MKLASLLKFIEDEDELDFEDVGNKIYKRKITPPPVMTGRILRDLGLFNVIMDTEEEGRTLLEYYCSVAVNPKRSVGMKTLLLKRGQPVYEHCCTDEKEKQQVAEKISMKMFDYMIKDNNIANNVNSDKQNYLAGKLCMEYIVAFRKKLAGKLNNYNRHAARDPAILLQDEAWMLEELRFIRSMGKMIDPGNLEDPDHERYWDMPLGSVIRPKDERIYLYDCANAIKDVADVFSLALDERGLEYYDLAISEYKNYKEKASLKKIPQEIGKCEMARDDLMRRLGLRNQV